jgi:hypothetical protein
LGYPIAIPQSTPHRGALHRTVNLFHQHFRLADAAEAARAFADAMEFQL